MERWWARDVGELETDVVQGLSESVARERIERYGKNSIETGKGSNPLKIFLRQFRDPLVFILLIAAGISAFVGEVVDSALISIIIVFNAVLGFVQEYKAEKAINALKKMVTPKAKVIRDGKVAELPATEVVPGDLVILEEGRAVPADLRLVEVKGLKIDESMLTGESTPVLKDVAKLPEETALADRNNMAYMGTLVVRGHGKGVVVATGQNTEMGKIASEISKSDRRATRLEMELKKLGSFITKTVVGVAVVTAGVILMHKKGAVDAVLTSVSLAVAAIPEGLPTVVTIALALGVRQMAKRKAVMRRLKSVETLGSVDIICSDKTGTITQNRMKVVEVEGDEDRIAEIGFFCHALDEEGKGDPTEMAIFEWVKKRDFEGRKVEEIPFDSDRKRMTVVVERGGKKFAYMKGAPEVVISLCSLKPNERKKIAEVAESMASRGLRVLAMAWKEYSGGDPEEGLLFAGFVGLLDPPREDAIKALNTAVEAGIKVIMITGDHARTAEAVAKMVGLEGRVVTGKELDEMSDVDLDRVIEKVAVFARVSPHHKPRIVEALQKRGHVVAMTGDGVNDAVALKRADIGIAMGSGTDVAKEAADMILINDSFATIVAAIEEGRRIFNNIKSFVIYLLSANVGEVVAVFSGSILGYVILKPVQILWINLMTDGPPALAISADPAPEGIMKKPPRPKEEGLLTRRDKIMRIFVFGLILGAGAVFIYITNASDPLLARTAVLTAFVMFEIVRIMVVRDVPIWKNRWLMLAIAVVFAVQIALIYSPAGNLLGLKPLTTKVWGEIIATSVAIFGIAKILRI